jgi:hypothetical protein
MVFGFPFSVKDKDFSGKLETGPEPTENSKQKTGNRY